MIDNRSAPYAGFVLRLALGAMFIADGDRDTAVRRWRMGDRIAPRGGT